MPAAATKSVFSRYEALEDDVRRAREAWASSNTPATRAALAAVHTERGRLRVALAAGEMGLIDLLRALLLHTRGELVTPEQLAASSIHELLAWLPWVQPHLANPRAGKPDEAVTLPFTHKNVPCVVYAQLGEAFRLYVRDVLLSQPLSKDSQAKREQCEQIVAYARRSIQCFNSALTAFDLEPKPLTPDHKAWIFAHRGATYTVLYWLARATIASQESSFPTRVSASAPRARKPPRTKDSAQRRKRVVAKTTAIARVTPEADPDVVELAASLFRRAEASFTLALEEKREYLWAHQFKAFLFALRGTVRNAEDPSDFRRARNLLRAKLEGKNLRPSFLSRHEAMLYSYDAADSCDSQRDGDRDEAAKRSIEASWAASVEDSEEYNAPTFAAISGFRLNESGKLDDEALDSMIASARMRARNAFSQSLVALAGLNALTAAHATRQLDAANGGQTSVLEERRDRAQAELKKLAGIFEWFPPDLETLAIILRDPLSKIVKNSTYSDLLKQFALPLELIDRATVKQL